MTNYMATSLTHTTILKQSKSLNPRIRALNKVPAIVRLLQMCRSFREVNQLHGQLVVSGLLGRSLNAGRLLESYVKTTQIDYALSIFERIPSPDVFAYNTILRGLTLNNYSYTFVLKACSHLQALSEERDVASWSAMVSGYTKNGKYAEALEVLREMMVTQVPPNESTFVSSLAACAQLRALDQGRWIHAYLVRNRGRISHTLSTALIDMYAKCGCIECAYEVFQNMHHRDIITWGVIISGFAMHGQVQKCFELFQQMVAGGISPNEVIFVSILSACSHAGYVEMGYCCFNKMVHDFGIIPSTEHYGCMVDLLGRAGKLAEAEQLIKSMPEKPNSVIWGSLLNACRTYKDVTRGNRAFRQLMELEPKSGDRYKLAGLMLARAGEKEDAYKMRKFIEENNLKTTRGLSTVEVEGLVQEFVAGDVNHNELREICNILEGLTDY
ncbi:Pentatricopeptide repeat-containing protein [Quillaja saponaria]|uniref:Pentatricopeptide repeat-containing protein n=1 Tax=Quillaja saponaria TaxID=32244 RepID=A0AAD7LU61_QUISA|nr:Pentatricopeptide repeat-containing protein [Quillaja saponaria]